MKLRIVNDHEAARSIRNAKSRAVFATPGVTDAVAAALIATRKRLGREWVRVILDGSAHALRLGYGQADSMSMLMEHDVDVRVEPGLRVNLLVVDDQAAVFMLPAMLVEDPHQTRGPNALILPADQVEALMLAIAPDLGRTRPAASDAAADPAAPAIKSDPAPLKPLPPQDPKAANEASPESAGLPRPQIGKQPLLPAQVTQVEGELARNPPQRFDLSRTLNVFNAYVEFIELRLIGLQISRHTVKLPADLILALRDNDTAKRLRATFNLVDADSKVGREADAIEAKVRLLRERFVRPVGDLGAITLRSKRPEMDAAIKAITIEIERFRGSVMDRLTSELDASRAKLVAALTPALRKKPPENLSDQVSGRITNEQVERYLNSRLLDIFPRAEALVGDMRLDCLRKGVTYETLASVDFQETVRKAFPFEDWNKPFAEFTAAQAVQVPLADM